MELKFEKVASRMKLDVVASSHERRFLFHFIRKRNTKASVPSIPFTCTRRSRGMLKYRNTKYNVVARIARTEIERGTRNWNVHIRVYNSNVLWHSIRHGFIYKEKGIISQFILSVVRAKVVRTDRRLGFTPRFSQFIHDKRAVRSANWWIPNRRTRSGINS